VTRILLLTALSLALAVPIASTAAAASGAGHSKRQAELNVIRATSTLRKLRVPFFDRVLNTLPSNTHVTCAGRGRAVHRLYRAFVCAVTYRERTVRLKYVVTDGIHFRLLRAR
jgi:hypothetical protein